jgi:hypothetical protein
MHQRNVRWCRDAQWPGVVIPSCRRAAILIEPNAFSNDECDWAGVQRVMLMTLLRDSGRTLKSLWEDAQRCCAGKPTASKLQAYIDQLTAGQQAVGPGEPRGAISAFYLEGESVLAYDDVYDALVCL